MPRRGSALLSRILGVAVDGVGRCAHWRGPTDVVAIRLPCCPDFYACHSCHQELAGHPARPWPQDRFDEPAVLCGACRGTLPIRRYLAVSRCPRCDAPFNPRCRLHHPLYFDVPG